jgi:hypothetical protein
MSFKAFKCEYSSACRIMHLVRNKILFAESSGVFGSNKCEAPQPEYSRVDTTVPEEKIR